MNSSSLMYGLFAGTVILSLGLNVYASDPLIIAPIDNDTIANLESIQLGEPSQTNGVFNVLSTGVVTETHTSSGAMSLDASQNLSPLPFGMEIISQKGGIKGTGPSYGIRGKAPLANGLFGRIGVEGRVTARQPNNQVATVRGFAGYLEYLPTLGASIENNIPLATLTGAQNALLDDFVRISKGVAWAFYTPDKSKFVGNVGIFGNIVAVPPSSPLTFTQPSTATVPALEVLNGNVTVGSLYVDDFDMTDDLENEFSMQVGAKAFNHSSTTVDQDFSKDVSCPADSIRLGCSGGIVDPDDVTLFSPFIGVIPVGTNGCRAFARKPGGSGANDILRAYAYCWNP